MLRNSVCALLVVQLLCRGVDCTRTEASPAARANIILDLLAFGRHHRHGKTKGSICEESEWRKQSLKLIKEVPFAGIFRDLQGESKFEASGLVHVNDTYYAVFDRCTVAVKLLINICSSMLCISVHLPTAVTEALALLMMS